MSPPDEPAESAAKGARPETNASALEGDPPRPRPLPQPPPSPFQKEAIVVGAVLATFGFCGMYFFLREPLEKSLFIGLVGGAIGAFRFTMRAMIKRR